MTADQCFLSITPTTSNRCSSSVFADTSSRLDRATITGHQRSLCHAWCGLPCSFFHQIRMKSWYIKYTFLAPWSNRLNNAANNRQPLALLFDLIVMQRIHVRYPSQEIPVLQGGSEELLPELSRALLRVALYHSQ